jgi:hypothetical protein
MYGIDEKCSQNLFGKPERKRPCGRPRHRWKGNLTMDVKYMRGEHAYWSRNQWWALVNTIINEEYGFLGCQRLIVRKETDAALVATCVCLPGFLFDPEDRGDLFIRNVGPSPNCIVTQKTVPFIVTVGRTCNAEGWLTLRFHRREGTSLPAKRQSVA